MHFLFELLINFQIGFQLFDGSLIFKQILVEHQIKVLINWSNQRLLTLFSLLVVLLNLIVCLWMVRLLWISNFNQRIQTFIIQTIAFWSLGRTFVCLLFWLCTLSLINWLIINSKTFQISSDLFLYLSELSISIQSGFHSVFLFIFKFSHLFQILRPYRKSIDYYWCFLLLSLFELFLMFLFFFYNFYLLFMISLFLL